MKIKTPIKYIDDPLEHAYKTYEKLLESKEKYNAFITLRKWEEIEKEVNKADGPLKGLILPVKDNISTKGILTTCASKILENYIPPYDAFAVEQLKKLGVVVAGKTNMDEFAMGNTSETSFYGPVKNPWREGYVPGGSSGGSAVATLLAGVPSLGSDTGGSVRQPAAYNYVLGLKPTYGLVSRYGLISYADSLEQIGIFSRYAVDLAEILLHISKYDKRDGTMPITHKRKLLQQNLSTLVETEEPIVTPEKMSIAYSNKILELSDPEVQKLFQKTLELLEKEGFRIHDIDLSFMQAGLPTYYIITMVEASSNLMRYDGIQYGYSENIGEYFTNTSITRSKGFGEEVKRRIIIGALLSSKGYEGRYYLKALKLRRWIRDSLQKILEKHDYIILPTTPSKPPRFKEALGPKGYIHDLYTVIPNLTGHPAINIPMGHIDGLPVGVQLITNWFRDDLLIKIAYLLENKIYDPFKEVKQG